MDVIEIQQNVIFDSILEIMDESVIPSVPLNISELTLFISVKKLNDHRDDDAKAVITSEIISHTFPSLGLTRWVLTAAQTFIALGRYKADVRVLNSATEFVNSDTFYVDIVPIVTKRTV